MLYSGTISSMDINVIVSIYLFLLGLVFGSFVLAVVDRMKSGRDWVKGRSECESCKHVLRPVDLVPVFSWLSTGGKCRYCRQKLSAVYPLTEISVGISFLFSYIFWPVGLVDFYTTAMFVVWLSAVVAMAGLFLFDMRWYLLPNKLIRPLIVFGLVWAVLDVLNRGMTIGIIFEYVSAVIVGAGVFLILYVISKGKWIGDGDIRLGVAIGLFTGNPFEAWLVIFIASMLGLIASIPTIVKLKKKRRLNIKIPFGPVLILGLYITVMFGAQIIEWYKTNILYL
jgi:leader peptidase (prepilin peptidase) / N-methyltransferase